jgi:hypothetical protein
MALRSRGLQMIDQAFADMQARRTASAHDQEDAQQRYYAQLLSSMPASQRMATIVNNPNWQQSGKITIPEYQKTDAEKLQDIAAADGINRYPKLAPEQLNAATFQLATGAAEPKDVMETDIQRQTLSPEDFAKAVRISGGVAMKPAEVATTTETNRHNVTEEGQTAPVRLAQTGLYHAETGKNIAETGKIGAETKGIQTKSQLATAATTASASSNPIVQGLVTRTYDPSLMKRFKPEEQAALFGAAQAIDPTVNLSDYQIQFGTKKDFNSGKSAQAIRSINQLVGHIKQLNDLKGQLNNSNILPGVVNPISNFVAGQTSPKFQKSAGAYEATAHAVGNELETMLRGSSQSGQKEREDVMSRLSLNRSPAAIDGAISAALNLMASRANELRDQYQKGVGRPADFTMLNPESEKVLRDLGADPTVIATLSGSMAPNPGAPSASPETRTTPDGKKWKKVNGGWMETP